MNKSNHFSTKSVFGQLISLIDEGLIVRAVKKCDSDRYSKRFKTKDHLISMLFCSFSKCTSLREISGAMLGLSGKTADFQLNHIPKRSTLSDANKKRDVLVFENIYHGLLKQYGRFLSDSRIKEVIKKQVKIFDSTTISLFKDILEGVGRNPKTGKNKGGIKVHTVVNADEIVPSLVWFSEAKTHDHNFLEKLKCDENTIYVFDKGYNDYKAFEHFSQQKTGFVTRIKDNASYRKIEQLDIEERIHSGVLADEIIEIEVKKGKATSKLALRKVRFYDRQNKREFEFLTNLFEMRADLIAALYKIRWQIELLFKQLKQNFPLKYFLGDNENAIKIQIYCVLIVNLLLAVIKKRLKRNWAFSNLVSFCKIHLFNHINLMKFLENPEKDWEIARLESVQLTLF
ncbi:IS4 family transposase [Elizabethkingia sp. M8]|uniref:IS4 family transposase n=1 Tax=Elizabethkingia sp. M8 TaxID=2796140 RepID=UPI001908B638|nr:IS4 family transposase [Elizabethkingia sp. M8]QQM25976.1 IS4 family transposase [Elizabethkingia sp. M8]QQM26816.1 IS4 family transposase [Elizabethkingia sp. M8]QQM26882.1 IS4 family transposase [Elizabethkingia sp. M8]QQM28192.1 IS4 family transposase [Elizabethkingia sp. M8]